MPNEIPNHKIKYTINNDVIKKFEGRVISKSQFLENKAFQVAINHKLWRDAKKNHVSDTRYPLFVHSITKKDDFYEIHILKNMNLNYICPDI